MASRRTTRLLLAACCSWFTMASDPTRWTSWPALPSAPRRGGPVSIDADATIDEDWRQGYHRMQNFPERLHGGDGPLLPRR